MVAAKSSRVNRQYNKKYRIRNWREYESGRRSRATDSRRALKTASSDTSPCSEAGDQDTVRSPRNDFQRCGDLSWDRQDQTGEGAPFQ